MAFNAKEYKKLWTKKNRERVRENKRRYYAEHKEQILKRRKELLENMDEEKKEELREKRKGYCKKYRDTHKEQVTAYKKKYREEHEQEHREENLRSYYRHRDRIMEERREKYNHASRRINYAMKMGKIKRQPCEICGAKPAEAHHDDYNEPLEVRWLCKECHVNWHKNNKPIYKETNE